MDSLRDRLLQHEGIDPAGAGPQELIRFRALLAAEQKRARRLGWLALLPPWGMFLILLGLCISESLLEHLNIPLVTAFGAVIIGVWVILVPLGRRLGRRLGQSRERILKIQHELPEYAEIKSKGITVIARQGDTRFIFWPGVLLITLMGCIAAVVGGNAVWWLLTRSFSGFVSIWQIAMALLFIGVMIRYSLTRPLSTLRPLDQPDLRFWIPSPQWALIQIPPVVGKTCITGLLGLIGILSIFCFFQGNDVYARAMDALKQARTIHAIGYNFKDGQRIKTSEIWYQQGKGTHIQCRDGEQVVDLYDDGQYSYHHTQGQAYAVKKETRQLLLPRELTEPLRYLKWSRRDASRDKETGSGLWQCYKREDPNHLSLMWIEWKVEMPRFRTYEEYRWVEGRWEQRELIEIDYDLPMDLVMPPALFEQEGIRIVEPEQVLRSQYSLDHGLDRIDVLGLTFAVHDLQRWGDYLFITCSVRPTEDSLRELEAKGDNRASPGSLTYGSFDLTSWWQRKADGQIEEHPYAILGLGCLHQDGVETRWYALLPKGDWLGRQERFEVCAHLRAHEGLRELRQEKGLAWHEQFRPLLTLAIPKEETSLERLASQYNDLAPMVVEVTRSSQRLFVSEAKDMTQDQFQAHLKDLLAGMRPMQEFWDQVGSDLHIEYVDEHGVPVARALIGSDIRRTDQGPYHWYDREGHRQACLVSDEQGQVRLGGPQLFSQNDSRNALACVYAFHEQRHLAAIARISEQDFGRPVRVSMQPACRLIARFTHPQSGGTESVGTKVLVRLSTTLGMTRSSSLIVDVLAYTLNSGRFEVLLVPGEYELSVYDGDAPSEIKAHHRFAVPKGTRDLDLGSIEFAAR